MLHCAEKFWEAKYGLDWKKAWRASLNIGKKLLTFLKVNCYKMSTGTNILSHGYLISVLDSRVPFPPPSYCKKAALYWTFQKKCHFSGYFHLYILPETVCWKYKTILSLSVTANKTETKNKWKRNRFYFLRFLPHIYVFVLTLISSVFVYLISINHQEKWMAKVVYLSEIQVNIPRKPTVIG